MIYRRAIDLGFVALSALMIGAGVIAVVAMLLTALAFTTDTTTVFPFAATFGGFRDATGASAAGIDGSWVEACRALGATAAAMLGMIARVARHAWTHDALRS